MTAGILGLGAYLPPTVRTNDWWPDDLVQSWRNKSPDFLPNGGQEFEDTKGQRLVAEAIQSYQDDPFCGVVERRILDDHLPASFMEVRAGEQALANAGLEPGSIDAVLGFSFVPDYQMSPNPCAVHRDLGLRRDCMVMAVDASCDSFLHQLTVAEGLISTGRFRNILIVQSSLLRRTLVPNSPVIPWFGDAATAAVVAPVDRSLGIQAVSHLCDGRFHESLVMSVPGGRWYDQGLPVFHPQNLELQHSLVLNVADDAKVAVETTLSDANVGHDSVGFYACHQPTSWFRPVTQKYIGLDNASFIDTVSWAGHIGACSIPLSLFIARQENTVRKGDWISTFSCGSGATWSGLLMRWSL